MTTNHTYVKTEVVGSSSKSVVACAQTQVRADARKIYGIGEVA